MEFYIFLYISFLIKLKLSYHFYNFWPTFCYYPFRFILYSFDWLHLISMELMNISHTFTQCYIKFNQLLFKFINPVTSFDKFQHIIVTLAVCIKLCIVLWLK